MATRFLIFGPSWLGDVVMAIPTYRALRRALPDAHVAVLARSPVAGVYEMVPEVDELVLYDRPQGMSRLAAYTGLVKRLRAVRADCALILPRSFGAAWTAVLSEASRRIGYAAAGRGFLLTDPVPRKQELLATHRVHYLQNLLRPLGIEPAPEAPVLALTDEHRRRGARLLEPALAANPSRLVAINPGANYGSAKQWPEERYVELARRLLDATGVALVIVGGPGDHGVCDRIFHALGAAAPQRVFDLSGRTTIPELAAVLERADLVVSNDTGAMHVAAAVGTRIVAIFGPTDPVTTSPYGTGGTGGAGGKGGGGHVLVKEPVACSPCLLRECPIDHRCMTRITADRVFDEVFLLLGESALSGAGRTA